VLLVTLTALVAALVGVSVVVVRATDGAAPVAQDDPGPVLLVSGYGGSTASLEPMRSALLRAGRDVVVVPPVGDGTGDLDEQADALGRRADAARDRFGAASVDVVGYSAGGVVARSWVKHHGGAATARRVVSVGSPQHGTTVADLAAGLGGRCPTACTQLAPDSRLLRSLNARDETPAGPSFVSVWSDDDDVVVPAASARLRGALNLTVQSVCPRDRSRHGDLPSDPVVEALLTSALGRSAPAVPAHVTC
jgi:triacylglycerol esterase/lipase EstA (alpha/beta hydrolase family)